MSGGGTADEGQHLSVADFPLSKAQLREWNGACLDLVNDLMHSHPTGDTLWIDNPTPHWRFHAALVLDGAVYDAWHPHVRLPPAAYVAAVFGEDVSWEINPGQAEFGDPFDDVPSTISEEL